MRIALVAPLFEAVPPKYYGGTERVVATLADELVQAGHRVTLFASGESQTAADLVVCVPRSLRLAGISDHLGSTLCMMREVHRQADDFDIIHFHIDLLPQAMFLSLVHKCLTTLHGRLDLPDFLPFYAAHPEMPLVSISHAQRQPMPASANWLANIPHGLPAKTCPFNPEGGDYLAFLGRISPEKRPDRAIQIAKMAKVPLKIAAKVDRVDRDYYEQEIKPLLDCPLIDYIGEISEHEKGAFLGKARALLFPIDWPEPFGLVMIESLSVGTPVIAWRRGSVPEVLADGASGIIVESIEEAVAAVHSAKNISRAGVRREFERRFTAARMAADYVAAYRKLLETSLIGTERTGTNMRRLAPEELAPLAWSPRQTASLDVLNKIG